MRGNEDLSNGGGCSCCALWSFLQPACPSGCVPNKYFWFGSPYPGTVLRVFWTSSFEHCAGYHIVRAGAPQ